MAAQSISRLIVLSPSNDVLARRRRSPATGLRGAAVELVSASPDGDDQSGIARVGLDLLAQTTDQDIDHSIGRSIVVTADRIKQMASRPKFMFSTVKKMDLTARQKEHVARVERDFAERLANRKPRDVKVNQKLRRDIKIALGKLLTNEQLQKFEQAIEKKRAEWTEQRRAGEGDAKKPADEKAEKPKTEKSEKP